MTSLRRRHCDDVTVMTFLQDNEQPVGVESDRHLCARPVVGIHRRQEPAHGEDLWTRDRRADMEAVSSKGDAQYRPDIDGRTADGEGRNRRAGKGECET